MSIEGRCVYLPRSSGAQCIRFVSLKNQCTSKPTQPHPGDSVSNRHTPYAVTCTHAGRSGIPGHGILSDLLDSNDSASLIRRRRRSAFRLFLSPHRCGTRFYGFYPVNP